MCIFVLFAVLKLNPMRWRIVLNVLKNTMENAWNKEYVMYVKIDVKLIRISVLTWWEVRVV